MNGWVFAVGIVAQLAVAGPQGPKDAVIDVAAQLFGPRVLTPEFFEVDRFRVLRLQFAPNGRLAEAAVEPKFYFRDLRPDWEEPKDFDDMTVEQYRSVVDRLERIYAKGSLTKAAEALSYVTNLLARRTEEYENATLTWAEVVDLRRGERAPLRVRYVRLVIK